jgi:glycerol-3-phosphate dehydrogenase
MLHDFLEERWKGTKPVLWGDALREAEFSYWIYQGLFGAGDFELKQDDVNHGETKQAVDKQATDKELEAEQ